MKPVDINKFIYYLCYDFCKKYYNDELLILELNKEDLKNIIPQQQNKYCESLSSDIGADLILPSLVFLLSGICNSMINEGFILTKQKLQKYLKNKKDTKNIEKFILENDDLNKSIQLINKVLNM